MYLNQRRCRQVNNVELYISNVGDNTGHFLQFSSFSCYYNHIFWKQNLFLAPLLQESARDSCPSHDANIQRRTHLCTHPHSAHQHTSI